LLFVSPRSPETDSRTGGKFVPGLVVFSFLGYVGQSSWNMVERRRLESDGAPSKSILQRMADSKWIPLRVLSDDEFKHLLNEKLLSIEAEIALLDEKIADMERNRVTEAHQSSSQSSQNPPSPSNTT
jgi:hypothetical protein